ncbi:MAG TPA: molybdopterin dinucleotide binding domain-containing protein [Verrucomicrobiae bacterium]|nr:molybdopterin dinucleotide binding domain-containing protein [Verrucomicrobiae bacterium]
MTTTRRNLFKLAGGAAAGSLLTPAPWRLITDTALLSENWPGVPRPKRGEVSYRFGNCALCTAGCAVRARCVAGQPVALAGVEAHPLSRGALCTYGIAGHHLPYHPARLRQGPVAEASAAVQSAIRTLRPNEHCAVLDLRPGRTASWTYRRAMASVRNGMYLASESNTAVDLASAKTVLSLGVPVLDGWGTPGNVWALRGGFHLIQAEPVESRTAVMADLWLPIRAGSEAALLDAVRGGSASDAAAQTGLSEQQIASLARELRENGPSLVLDRNGASPMIARREAPVPEEWKKAVPATQLASVSEESIRVLLIDESMPGEYLPWSAIQPKLTSDCVVVSFAWSKEGYGRQARFTLPAAVYPEVVDDIPPAIDSPAAMFRLAAALVAPPEGMVSPTGFIAGLAGIDAKNALQERVAAIQKSGRGSVFDPSGAAKPADLWKALQAGATWIDDREPRASVISTQIASPLADDKNRSSAPLAIAFSEPRAAALVSPLMSKVTNESGLRLGTHGVAIHPSDARGAGLAEGSRARLETASGFVTVDISVDDTVPPGVIQVGGGPDLQNVCGANRRGRVVAL